MSAPTFLQIKALAQDVRKKRNDVRAIGIRSKQRWTEDRVRQEGNDVYVIDQCDSQLAMRIALQESEPQGGIKILITPLDENEIGEDVRLRLAGRHLLAIKPWEIVRQRFQAAAIDPRLSRHAWMPERLLAIAGTENRFPAPGGFLDAETVWPLLWRHEFGLEEAEVDLIALLKWSLDERNVRRFCSAAAELRQAAREWLSQAAGPAAEAVIELVESQRGTDATALGLALGSVLDPRAQDRLQIARVRLEERYLGGATPPVPQVRRWSAAAADVLRMSDPAQRHRVVTRCDAILQEVEADQFAHVSDVSPLGFEQRLAALGEAIVRCLEDRGAETTMLEAPWGAVQRHDIARRDAARVESVQMAIRLVRWLKLHAAQGPRPATFAEAVRWYSREGAMVDWARTRIERSGDRAGPLSQALAKVWKAATDRREDFSRLFAELLRDWTAAGSRGEDALPVEQLLDRIVAPLASAKPVLLIVLDGLSGAVYREMIGDVLRDEWSLLCRADESALPPLISTVPSVTRFARASLFAGKLCEGASASEARDFAASAALREHCRKDSPPVLFHKADLHESEDSGLAPAVRREVASSHRRIVGVVINAVDDHLMKSEQLDIRWSRDQIRSLAALLHEARSAGRLVIIASDHGHVLDCGTSALPGADETGGHRYRGADTGPGEGEIEQEGSRVLFPGGRVVGLWSERFRYGSKHHGYHGGVSPQEMLAPLAVLMPAADSPPDGWMEAPLDTPAWWDETVRGDADGPPPAEMASPKSGPARPGYLFDPESVETRQPAPAAPSWLASLLASPAFQRQKERAGRAVPSDDQIAALLAELDKSGGKLLATAVARRLKIPPLRLGGFLSLCQRLLNVEGYQVLSRDQASDTVELNRDLLLRQFELEPM